MIRSLGNKTPQIHKTAFVSEFAYVVGDVVVGADSSIWPGAVVRGDMGRVTIGKNTNIQDNAVVHADADTTIGDNVTVAHLVVWHGKSLGDNCMLGNGATVNGHVEIGANSIVASGAVVLDRLQIPANSLVVGIPAKVAGATSDRHLQMIQGTAAIYAKLAQQHKAAGL